MFKDILREGYIEAFIRSTASYSDVIEITSYDLADQVQIWLSSNDARRLGEHLIELARIMKKEL